MSIQLLSADFFEKRDELRLHKIPNVPNILAKPVIICFGALQDPVHPHVGAKHSAKTICRIVGITGKGNVSVYTTVYNIAENLAKHKSRRNNDPLTTTPYDQDAYNFAKQYLVSEIENELKSLNRQKLNAHFSNLIISSFSYGGMAAAEVLNATHAILVEAGFSPKEACSILSHTTHISIADPVDFSFYESGATVYRVLNESDVVLKKYSSNTDYIHDWLKSSKIKPDKDGYFVDSAHFENQHTIMLRRSPGREPNNVIADMSGNFHDPQKTVAVFNRLLEPTNHNSTSYFRHALSRHGFFGPAIIQNLHYNALNNALAYRKSIQPKATFEDMIKVPDTLLFTQDLPDKNRSHWSNTAFLIPTEEYRDRIKNGVIHLHRS